MKFVITGANRGLGLTIFKTLLQRPFGLYYGKHDIFLTARSLDILKSSISHLRCDIPSNFTIHLQSLDFTTPSRCTELLTDVDCLFHTASPYSKSSPEEATDDEKELFRSFLASEELLLSSAAESMSSRSGRIVAAGAIVGDATTPEHLWYCGLFSLSKAQLKETLQQLARRYSDKDLSFVYANLGTFIDSSTDENKARIESGEALSIAEIAHLIIKHALQPVPGFSAPNHMTASEFETYQQFHSDEDKKKAKCR